MNASRLLSAPQSLFCLDPTSSHRSFIQSYLLTRHHFYVSGVARRWLPMKGARPSAGSALSGGGLVAKQGCLKR